MSTKILLVDDNEDLLKITQLILVSQGYEVVAATSIEEAELQIAMHQPQILLLDVCICHEDGLLFCNRLKQEPLTRNMRVILMSGNDYQQEDWNGADDFLCKPFDFATLTQKVEQQVMALTPVAAGALETKPL